MSVNSVCISGNVTRAPELRATAGGTQVLRLGVAVNDRARNRQTGEWEDRPNFVDVVVFGARAEALQRILAKGMKVAVSGRLSYSQWQAADGSPRSRLEVVAEEVDLMQRRAQAVPAAQGQGAQAAPQTAAEAERAVAGAFPGAARVDELYDEDVPF